MIIFVRNLIILFSLMVIFAISYHNQHQKIHNDLSQPPAERQVYYRIGTIDPRFNLSEEEAKTLVREAAQIWEQPLGHPFFFYNPKAVFTINFIYDQRQQTSNARQQAERELTDGQDRNQVASNDFDQQKSALEDEYHRHNDELSALNERIAQHEQNVAMLNSRGGAAQSEIQVMQVGKDQIDRDVAAFNQDSMDLDVKKVNLNHQGENIQSQLDVYNQQAHAFNQNFVGHPFEAGLYKGDAINIYEFDNRDNLRLILGHELGHSLGIKHTNDPQSLMYPMIGKQDATHFLLTQSDINLLYGRGRSY
jgi:predicted Zn-dependent protease